MNVKVPTGRSEAFVAEVGSKPEWYVARKYNPEARVGERIRFYEGATLVGTAKVDRIDAPGQSDINKIDRREADFWIVWFLRETFRVAGHTPNPSREGNKPTASCGAPVHGDVDYAHLCRTGVARKKDADD
jgi:hypothetical protein